MTVKFWKLGTRRGLLGECEQITISVHGMQTLFGLQMVTMGGKLDDLSYNVTKMHF